MEKSKRELKTENSNTTSLSHRHVTLWHRPIQEVNSLEPNTVLWHSTQYSHQCRHLGNTSNVKVNH